MADRDDLDPMFPGMDSDRRAFLKRMAIGAAAAPAVVSFSMAALSAQPAYAAGSNGSNQSPPVQTGSQP